MAKFLIVEARWYDHLNDMLIAGAPRPDVMTAPSRSAW
jgi:6,7-dimethyl-8-ribityllumazine synthase